MISYENPDHGNLEEFADAQNYDMEDTSDTGVAFYSALAQETGSPVLEIACGTGRVSIPIARQGFAVTGLDIVPGMLDQARRKSAGLPTRWVEADARAFDLGEEFRLVFLTGNAFQLFLTRTDQEALLQCVQAHLHDEGLLAFTRNPRWAKRSHADRGALREEADLRQRGLAFLKTHGEEEVYRTYTDIGGRSVQVSKTQAYDAIAQVLHWTSYRRWHEGDREQTQVTRIKLRYTFPQELEALLHYNGFSLVRQYGDWNLEPLTAESPSIISVCRRRR